jgi:STELLO glycosyltransferases
MNFAVVVTSISAPNDALKSLASGALAHRGRFIVIGDAKSPVEFQLDGCEYYSVSRQRETGLKFAAACPLAKYSRKNIGYLLAIRSGVDCLVETDDDNIPRPSFWNARHRHVIGRVAVAEGWVNAYRYFTDAHIYPRGFPLELIAGAGEKAASLVEGNSFCAIQQGLADENPDVDAVYRMLLPLPISFDANTPVILPPRAWCPFNSQNTTFFREAFPLLYLPTYCSFRMTDIWRSFVAQRILWECDGSISFHAPTVFQVRNEHDLLRDFEEEIPGYLNNARMAQALMELNLRPGAENIRDNMISCYEMLVSIGLVKVEELPLLQMWFQDLHDIGKQESD